MPSVHIPHMLTGLLVSYPIVLALEVLFAFVVHYIWKEMSRFKSKSWTTIEATEKSISIEEFKLDGDPTWDVICTYNYKVGAENFTGSKPYFGNRISRLDANDLVRLKDSQFELSNLIYYNTESPEESVAFFLIPNSLRSKFWGWVFLNCWALSFLMMFGSTVIRAIPLLF